jgi:hypothetical protein
VRTKSEPDTAPLGGFEQCGEMFRNIRNPSVKRFIVGRRPCSAGEIFSQLMNAVGG